MSRFGGVQVLVYNAGLTFTTIDLARFRRAEPQKFWQVSDDILRAVIETNYIAADQMARRVAPTMVEQGWGRIVNVTTKLDTMNRPHTSPYGASKAALEMATEVWAKEVEGTGLTINIVNPGAGAYTPGMAEEMRSKAAPRASSSPKKCYRRCSTSSRANPTTSTATASTLTSGTVAIGGRSSSLRRLRNAPAIGLMLLVAVIRLGSRRGGGRHSPSSRVAPSTGDW